MMRRAALAYLLAGALADQNGEGVETNYEESVKWLRLAAAQGNRVGLCNLGYMHDRGWGVEQDDGVALRLYHESARLGFGQCMFNLGVFYRDGRGTTADPTDAFVWFSLADRERIPQAAQKAGDMGRLLSPAQLAEAKRHLAAWEPAEE